MKIQTFLWQECQDFCEALAGDPELARQEISKAHYEADFDAHGDAGRHRA
jgi:hypothetical protein